MILTTNTVKNICLVSFIFCDPSLQPGSSYFRFLNIVSWPFHSLSGFYGQQRYLSLMLWWDNSSVSNTLLPWQVSSSLAINQAPSPPFGLVGGCLTRRVPTIWCGRYQSALEYQRRFYTYPSMKNPPKPRFLNQHNNKR